MPEGSFRIDKALTNIAVEYANSEYIFPRILKDINVAQDSGKYFIYNNNFRIEETDRANGSPAKMATWNASTSSYFVTEHALKDVVTDEDVTNADNPFDLKADSTRFLVDKIMMKQEYDVMKLMFTTTTWSNNATLVSETSWKYHTTTSVPIQNILSATGVILKFTGLMPNALVLGWTGFEALKESPAIYDRIKYVERAMVTEGLLASLFDVENVYVGKAAYMAADEGQETTTSQTFIWGSDALLAYLAPNPGLAPKNRVSAAVMFRKATKGSPYRVKRWREEDIEGEFIEVQTKCHAQAVATTAAYLFKSIAL